MNTTAVDLFAGPGGWDLAARRLGIDVIGIEKDSATCRTREEAGLATICDDVRSYGPDQVLADGLIASPPCQTFSAGGGGNGREHLAKLRWMIVKMTKRQLVSDYLFHPQDADPTTLVLEPLRWALEAYDAGRPYRWIALEQVPFVGYIWQTMAESLRSMGYSVAVALLDAERYGVPQTRRRAILVASRERQVQLPYPTHSRYHFRSPDWQDFGVQPWVSMATALGWGMTGRPSLTVTGSGASGGASPFGNSAREAMLRELSAGRWKLRSSYSNGAMVISGSRAKSGQSQVQVTVSEAAVLQTFPAGYPWQGSKTKQYQQVGQAMPPMLAMAVLGTLLALDSGSDVVPEVLDQSVA